jgi:hypothetical protein
MADQLLIFVFVRLQMINVIAYVSLWQSECSAVECVLSAGASAPGKHKYQYAVLT